MCIFAKFRAKKPFANDGMTVEVRTATPEETKKRKGIWQRLTRFVCYPFHFIDQIYRTSLIIKHGEMVQPIAKTNDFQKFAIPFNTFFMNWRIVHHEPFMRAIVKMARHSGDSSGLFKPKHGIEEIVEFIRLIYPNEIITLDDCVLSTRDKIIDGDGKIINLLAKYRDPLLEFIGPAHVNKYLIDIHDIVESSLSHIKDQKINLESLCRDYSCTVLSKILLGHPGPFAKISDAVDFYSEWVVKAAQRRPLTAKEKEKLEPSLKTFRIEIDKVIELATHRAPHTEYVQSLLKNPDYTPVQIKAMLIILFFAGQETSSSLLTYLLWQLAKNPSIQKDLALELERIESQVVAKEQNESENDSQNQVLTAQLESGKLNNVLTEALRLFNPAYAINREAAEDLICTVKEKNEVVHTQFVPKGTAFFSCPYLAGRNPFKYTDPDQFNPNRFDKTVQGRNLSWLPFGFGKHACPGQWLAFLEIKLFIIGLLKNYELTTDTQSVSLKGFMTLTIGDEIFVTLEKRKIRPLAQLALPEKIEGF
jgi:cytochrome P450